MKNIYGTIGYTVLEDLKIKKKIIILADMHDTLPNCINQTNISDWFKSKFNSSKILLEEVPRENVELIELWSKSKHTQQLKNLFLKNNKFIHAIDIRPFLIPFSWEVINLNDKYIDISKETNNYDMILSDYLKQVNNFFCLRESYLLTKLPNYRKDNLKHTKLGKHFLKIKINYYNLLLINKKSLKLQIKEIYRLNIELLENINNLLNEIMEWYICACIDLYKHKTVIIHTGLAHSEKVINWLIEHYNFKFINKVGINKLDETNFKTISGCVSLPLELDLQFGGNLSYGFLS